MKLLSLRAIFFCFSLLISTVFAETLTVLTDKPSDIYINKSLVETGEKYVADVLPGEYLIELKHNNVIVYSQLITVESGNIKTVYVENKDVRLLESVMSREEEQNQAEFIFKNRGALGFGFTVGVETSGLQFSHDTLTTKQDYLFWYTGANNYGVFKYRYAKYLKGRYLRSKSIVRPYYGAGIGYYLNGNGWKGEDAARSDGFLLEIPFGIQITNVYSQQVDRSEQSLLDTAVSILIWPLFVYNMMAPVLNGAGSSFSYFLETGITASEAYTGVKVSGGATYYF